MSRTFPRIIKVVQVTPLQLAIVFDDLNVIMTDFRKLIRRGGMFLRLRDPQYVRKFKIIDDGRAIAWPGGLDFDADAIYGSTRRGAQPEMTEFGVRIPPVRVKKAARTNKVTKAAKR